MRSLKTVVSTASSGLKDFFTALIGRLSLTGGSTAAATATVSAVAVVG